MTQKNKTEKLLREHYRDLLELNKSFINALGRPRAQSEMIEPMMPARRRRLTKKQLNALAKGRKILSAKRSKKTTI